MSSLFTVSDSEERFHIEQGSSLKSVRLTVFCACNSSIMLLKKLMACGGHEVMICGSVEDRAPDYFLKLSIVHFLEFSFLELAMIQSKDVVLKF